MISLEGSLGVDKYDKLIAIVIEYASIDNNKALSYAESAKTLAFDLGDTTRIVKANRIIGQLLNRLNRSEAVEVHLNAIPMARRNNLRSDYKIMLNGLAFAYTIQAEYDKALDIHLQSLILREEDGDESEISITLNNIGFVYFKMKNYEKALDYYDRSLQLKRKNNDKYDLDRLLINIGLTYIHLKDFENAMKLISEGLDECKQDCNKQILIEAKFGLGVANFGKGEIEEAKDHFSESLEISLKTNNERFQAENLVYLGRVQTITRDYDSAKRNFEGAEIIATKFGYNQLLIDTYKEIARLYSLTEDFQKASYYQDRYIHLKDSLIGEELVKNVAKIQTNFEERENLATIRLKNEALVRQRNLNFAIGVIAMLAALLGFVLYRSNVVMRKVNSELSDAKSVIENQNLRLQNINRELDAKVKEKTADLVKANEDLDKANKSLSKVNDELDNFIYKTSHDIRGPLASLKGICSVALMDVKDPLALDYFNKLDISSGRLNVILTRLLIVNQINNAIVGKELIDFGGIVEDIILLEKKKGLPPRFEIKKEIQPNISFQSDKDLVRIILENLIDNAIKFHNESDRITPFVQINIGANAHKEIVVRVIDNGIGIAEAHPDKIFQMFSRASERSGTGGIGLYLSKLATEKLGGQIHLHTSPEGYTEFSVSFPSRMPVA